MKVGVFDSGLGGLTIVRAITDIFKGADIYYVADTAYAPYGQKTTNQILNRSKQITDFLIENHDIDVLVVACNTATSASIMYLREVEKTLMVVGTEPGIKPAIETTKTSKIGVLATTATLNGDKYQVLVDKLSKQKEVTLFEQACPGLVEQIENGDVLHEKTKSMLSSWLKPMRENSVDTIVLGCTHYPLVSDVIQEVMGYEVKLIETGSAIANRLKSLSCENGHVNEGNLNISILHTGSINTNMIDMIFENSKQNEKIIIRKCEI